MFENRSIKRFMSLLLILGLLLPTIFVMVTVMTVINHPADAETWTESSNSDFTAGESTFVESLSGTLSLARKLSCMWTGLGEAGGDIFSISVATAGDVNGDGWSDFIVGASRNDDGGGNAGEAYVYYGFSTGPKETADWSDQGEWGGDNFGYSVASAGDVNGDGYDDIIIGAPNNDSAGSNAGKTYVYHGSRNGLSTTPDWSDEGEAAGDEFGYSVASAGDVNGDGYADVIMGARYNDDAGSQAGEAYVYYGSSSGLSATPDWSDEGDWGADSYGYSVAGAGDVNGDNYDDIVVGAYRNDSAGAQAGKAYVYYGSDSGPSIMPDWTDVGEAAGDNFGCSVASAGDTNSDGFDDVIVGAYANDGGKGEAYVYHGSAGGLSGTPDWSDQGEATGDQYGFSVASAGDINGDSYCDVIVGAHYNDDAGSTAGEAYIYYGFGTGLSTSPDWSVQGDTDSDFFGEWVAPAGDVNGDGFDDVLIGANNNDEAGSNAGKAYLYGIPEDTIVQNWNDIGEAADDQFGGAVASAGDVNGDGFDDVICGSSLNDDGGADAGEAYVYFGSASGLSAVPDWSDLGEAADDRFGSRVAGAGDVDNDGYDDIMVTAGGNDEGGVDAGKVYVYHGSPTGPSATPDWSDIGEDTLDLYGSSISSAGDVNGDGYDDVIVGAYYNRSLGGSEVAGRVYVYHGSDTGLSLTPDWTDDAEALSDFFGYSVAGVGDVNRDGYDDVLISAIGNDDGGSQAGKVYAYFGSDTGLSATPDWSEEGETAQDSFGSMVASAKDVNSDGYDDIVIGAQGYDSATSNEGKVYVFYGSENGPGSNPDWTCEGAYESASIGEVLAGAGDINHDGYDDLIISIDGHDGAAGSNTGIVYVHFGSAIGLSDTPEWSKEGTSAGETFGSVVAGAGDVNNDGFCDMIIGAPYFASPVAGANAGKAYLFSMPEYAQNGWFTSDTFSVSGLNDMKWTSVEWRPLIQPKGTWVKFQIATNNGGSNWNFVGPDGTTNTYFTDPHGEDIAASNSGRFCKVRIYFETTIGYNTPTVTEFSVNYAQYDQPAVTVTSPNGGEDWIKAKWYPITWEATGDLGGNPIQLYYSVNNGQNWVPIGGAMQNFGYYNWTVPSITTPSAMIKITVTDIYGNTDTDTGDASFAIDPPPARTGMILSPRSGIIWGAGDHVISYSYDDDPSVFRENTVKLEYSVDGGTTWSSAGEERAHTGSVAWNITEGINSQNCLVRVGITDYYDEFWPLISQEFTIDTSSPLLAHTAPVVSAGSESVEISAAVQDNLNLHSVRVHYRYDQSDDYSIGDMSDDPTGPDQYAYQIMIPDHTDRITYYIEASDGANIAQTAHFEITIPEDVEGDGSSHNTNSNNIAEKNDASHVNGTLTLMLITFIIIALILSGVVLYRRRRNTDSTIKSITQEEE